MCRVLQVDLGDWFPAKYQLPYLTERLDRLHELGSVLFEEFGGLAANMVRAAGGSASKLVQLIIRYIPGASNLFCASIYTIG